MVIQLRIFNVTGEEVARLYSGTLNAGRHHIKWNGLNRNGQQAASGVYFYRLQGKNTVLTGKMMLLR